MGLILVVRTIPLEGAVKIYHVIVWLLDVTMVTLHVTVIIILTETLNYLVIRM